MTHLTFIRPNIGNRRAVDAMEPLVFGLLRHLTPSSIQTTLYDDRLEEIPFSEPTDMVAITVETYTAQRAYQIADQYRERGIPVVMGGYHPTFLPQEALAHADSVVVGDAEENWPSLLSDFFKGNLKSLYNSPPQNQLDDIRFDRSVFAGKSYVPLRLVQWGRGCPFTCDFCSIQSFYGGVSRHRSLDELGKEVADSGHRFVFFVDDNLFLDSPSFIRFLEYLVPLNVRWAGQISLNVARDSKKLKLLQESGCVVALMGFESLEAENLQQMNKSWNDRGLSYEEAIRRFREHGIMVYGTFVVGYDHDTPDTFEKVVRFAVEQKLFLANFNPLTPTPGTPLYGRLKAEGRLIRDPWWLDPSYRYGEATFRPRGMTPDQLTEGCYWARATFNRLSSIARRAVDFRANCRNPARLALHVRANLLNRREILGKQGSLLNGEIRP